MKNKKINRTKFNIKRERKEKGRSKAKRDKDKERCVSWANPLKSCYTFTTV